MYRRMISLIVLGTLVLCAGLIVAQEQKPDATIKLSAGSVAIGIGFSWGDGVLTYQGKDYPVSVSGLSVADVGISKAEATGQVYNLKRLQDFNGTYAGASAGMTIAGGGGATAIQNQNGVVIHLLGTTQGLKFKLSLDGVKLALKES